MLEWTFAGINTSLPGAGGDDCVNYIPPSQRIFETMTITGIFAYLSHWALTKLSFPAFTPNGGHSHPLRPVLLVLHCLVFGMELGFKCASESLLWTLNPCHILTIIQILMLACPPCLSVTVLFRLQMHMLNGPLLALAFPVLNTRQLPFEWVVYFMQHALLLLIPVIMLDQTTAYAVEPLDDLSWAVLALSLQTFYHFLILQPIALMTGINLNHMLCPAITDPFAGPHYRTLAMIHQPFLILILGKCISCFSLTWSSAPWPWQGTHVLVSTDRPDADTNASAVADAPPGVLLNPWLNSEPEPEIIALAATSWCWSDLFRYQTYLFDRRNSATPYNSTNKDTTANRELHSESSQLGGDIRHRETTK